MMVSKPPPHLPTTAHSDPVQHRTMRSALLNRNVPRRRRTQQVRFKDLEEDMSVTARGGAVPERHRLGAGPGSPHPNRKSPPGGGKSCSVVGAVWGDMAATGGGVSTILKRVPSNTLTPSPSHRDRARPHPLSVPRTYSHSLEDILGWEGPHGRANRATPYPTTAASSCYARSRPPVRAGRPLKDEPGKCTCISPPLPRLRTGSFPCNAISVARRTNGTTQSRRPLLSRTLSDPGNKDPPCHARRTAALPCIAPPTAENTERGADRREAKQPQALLPPLPPPPPPYSSCIQRRNLALPAPKPPTLNKKALAQGGSKREKLDGKSRHTHNPAPSTNPNPNSTLHQRPKDSNKITDPSLTPDQAQTLKEVEKLLGGLVSGARAGEGPKGGALSDVGGLKSRLQGLEGLLEASHTTIQLLLHLIQDMELQEGQSERKSCYGTKKNMEESKTSTDNVCVINSVENDFRLQEGIFTQFWRKAESQISAQAFPIPPHASNPRQEELSLSPLTARDSDRCPRTVRASSPAKKSRKRCFWFL